MGLLLFLLLSVIAGYWTVTDPRRVRAMAEQYLSDLLGGHVEVRRASLSVFEGLRLDGVKVFVDEKNAPDSCIFSARAFILKATPQALLYGKLETTQILALGPEVGLCENLDTGRWNYERLLRRQNNDPKKAKPSQGPQVLPQIVLRAGLVQYSRMSNGQYSPIGSMAIDGNLTPVIEHPADGFTHRYNFDLQSRAPAQPIGPRLRGQLDLSRPAVSAELENFEFDRAIRAMLPSQVQQWWDAHQLAGRITVPRFSFTPGHGATPADFAVTVELDGVRLAILPQDIGGRRWPMNLATARLAYQPVRLRGVSGRLVFTPRQIRFGINGRVENNAISLNGAIDGYGDDASASVQIVARNLELPQIPRYMPILPRDVLEEWAKFVPAGQCDFAARIDRKPRPLCKKRGGGEIEIMLAMDILDGRFCYEDFRYPLSRATGKVLVDTRRSRIDIINLEARGMKGTPNEDATVLVNGWVHPLGRYGEYDIAVKARGLTLDPPLRKAIPEEAHDAMAMFDRRLPGPAPQSAVTIVPMQASGNVQARIALSRKPDPTTDRKLTIDVDIDMERGEGEFESFPYPLHNVKGQILVRGDHVKINNLVSRAGDTELVGNGRVDFAKGEPVRPELIIRSKNVRIDDSLRTAVPGQYGQWLSKSGMGGLIDGTTRVYLDDRAGRNPSVEFDMDLSLHDGVIWPILDTHAVTDIRGELHLKPESLQIKSATGKRGQGTISGTGVVAWPNDRASFRLDIAARDLRPEPVLREMLAPEAREWWDMLRPAGRADVLISYSGGMSGSEAGATPTTQPADNYSIIFEPREFSINPTLLPILLEKIAGKLVLTPGKISFVDMSARNGDSLVQLSGANTPQGQWDLKLSAKNFNVTDALNAALPEALSNLFKSINLRGTISVDDAKVVVRPPTTAPAGGGREIAVQGRVSLADGSMDIGVPLRQVNSVTDLWVSTRGSELYSLSGNITADSLLLAGRSLRNLRCQLSRAKGANDSAEYYFREVQGKLGNGLMAGQISLYVPSTGSASYEMAAALKDVEVKDLVGDTDVRGHLSGSLALEGKWDKNSRPRGRGDVRIQGQSLYKIPVVFGLVQIANMTMPVKSPFTDATVRYSVESEKMTLEQIELRAAEMLMEGRGWVDFANKKVGMKFTTYNPNFPQIPVLGPLLEGARKELLEINVSGTVQDPQVSAKAMHTFTTTIDEVFRSPTHKTLTPDKRGTKKKPASTTQLAR